MPYKNIVFAKLEKRLLSDYRWYMMSEQAQLNYVKLILFAAETYNKIPKNLDAIKRAFKTDQDIGIIEKTIKEIKQNFPKFKENKHFYYFKDFEEKTNYIPKREIPRKSQGLPKDGVEKEEEKEKEKEKDLKNQKQNKDKDNSIEKNKKFNPINTNNTLNTILVFKELKNKVGAFTKSKARLAEITKSIAGWVDAATDAGITKDYFLDEMVKISPDHRIGYYLATIWRKWDKEKHAGSQAESTSLKSIMQTIGR